MRIGEVARRGGVRPATLRYYERRGLLAHPIRSGQCPVISDVLTGKTTAKETR
jgi:hypothetical protein